VAGSGPHVETAQAVDLPAGPLVVDLPPLRPVLLNGVRLVIETMVVPTALLYVTLHARGLIAGLSAAMGWYYLCVTARWIRSRGMPGRLAATTNAFTTGACATLATSSALLAYLIQPILGSCCMAAVFLGSAVIRRPVTAKLAMELVRLPAHIFGHPDVGRVLRHLALLWGISRLADAGISFGLVQSGVDTGLLSRGVLSPVLTMSSVLLCAAWGWRSLHTNGVRLRLAAAPTS
jgi:hypothetical protein